MITIKRALRTARRALFVLGPCALLLTATALAADADAEADASVRESGFEDEVTITATRTERDTFEVPNPVSVLTPRRLDEKNVRSVADAFRDLVGVDVSGVGANQPLP